MVPFKSIHTYKELKVQKGLEKKCLRKHNRKQSIILQVLNK